MEIRVCKKCGFILGTRPRLLEEDGICLACINQESKKNIDFKSRKIWLTNYIKENKTNKKYDCVVAISGGKDSHSIVRRLVENHGAYPLLVNITDEFTHTQAGKHNIDNLVKKYDLDLITFRCSPVTFIKETRQDFLTQLNPLKWIEERIMDIPVEIAKNYNIKLIFYGENPAFEYGEKKELNLFYRKDKYVEAIFLGAIYPYSIQDSLYCAKEIGFRDLDYYNEWQRQGSVENYTQIDSIGYIIHLWCKFIKFGFQRVSDISCRLVREGKFAKEQAMALIKERDYVCDQTAKRDFCRVLNIKEKEFDETVDRFANRDLLVKDVIGQWRRKDLL